MISIAAFLAVMEGDVWLAQGRRGGREEVPAEDAAPLDPPPAEVPPVEAPPVEPAAVDPEESPDAPAEPARPPEPPQVPEDPAPGEKGDEGEPAETPREARSRAEPTGERRTDASAGAPDAGGDAAVLDKGALPAPGEARGQGDPAKGGADAPAGEAAPEPVKGAEEPAAQPEEEAGAEEPAGRFLTAAEVRPILDATRASWVAAREWEGEDLLYFTHLESWRCGLSEIAYSVNGAGFDIWTVDPCFVDSAQPNAIGEDRLPYTVFPLGEIDTVLVRITYDDGIIDEQSYDRADIAID